MRLHLVVVFVRFGPGPTDMFDGKSGFTMRDWPQPDRISLTMGGLALRSAHDVRVPHSVSKGPNLCRDDVAIDIGTRKGPIAPR